MEPLAEGLGRYLSPLQLQTLENTRVCILGAGGLGSNCAQILVRSGFTRLNLVDFDVVSPSNLNRQFYFASQVGEQKVQALAENLKRIRSDLSLTLFPEKITAETLPRCLEGCQYVIEAVDDARTKKSITEAVLASGRVLIGASGMGGLHGYDAIRCRKFSGRFYVAGDFETGVEDGYAPYAPKVLMVAAKQAAMLMELVLTGECEVER